MITEREIRKAAEKLKNNKSPFSDKISNEMISKGYRPEARGYVIYSPRARPRARHEGNKSHNHELKADKRLIFTLARILQGLQYDI